jgi:hypothetical protein
LEDNVAHLKKLHERGRTQIILKITRPESWRELTEKQLKEAGYLMISWYWGFGMDREL